MANLDQRDSGSMSSTSARSAMWRHTGRRVGQRNERRSPRVRSLLAFIVVFLLAWKIVRLPVEPGVVALFVGLLPGEARGEAPAAEAVART